MHPGCPSNPARLGGEICGLISPLLGHIRKCPKGFTPSGAQSGAQPTQGSRDPGCSGNAGAEPGLSSREMLAGSWGACWAPGGGHGKLPRESGQPEVPRERWEREPPYLGPWVEEKPLRAGGHFLLFAILAPLVCLCQRPALGSASRARLPFETLPGNSREPHPSS